jgi:predicted dehydrogenase
MNIAIIGAGLIGKKRALLLSKSVKLSVICDVNKDRGEAFAKEFSCTYVSDADTIFQDTTIDTVFIATTHNWLAPLAIKAIKAGKHVFLEKPGGKNVDDIKKVIAAHKKNPVVISLGYNHRYHPAFLQAKKIIDSKKYGDILFIRAKYGHGGRIGYEKEWRFQKDISGGGELIDQGPHLIDLVQYFIGPTDEVKSFTHTFFWDTSEEDTAFFMLRNKRNQIAHLSVSCVEWKNIFVFEIMLKKAKIQIDGLGGSYGKEKLTLYKMKSELGPPDVEVFDFDPIDRSWEYEMNLFFDRIQKKDYSSDPLIEGKRVLEVIQTIYKENP